MGMVMKPWVERMAPAAMGMLILPFVWRIDGLRGFAIGMILVGVLATAVFAVGRMSRRDPYDLQALREVHEREAVRTLLEEEPTPDSDTVACRGCGACYSARIGVCPECGLIAGQ